MARVNVQAYVVNLVVDIQRFTQYSRSCGVNKNPIVFFSIALAILFSSAAAAQKVSFAPFCQALAGQWQGSSARANQTPKQVSVVSVCSADGRQLMLSVSQAASHRLSETWWFRDKGEYVQLTYFDGIDEDKTQHFSLYQQGANFSLVGEGVLNKRPALIQLRFDKDQQGWMWLQNAQYLDDDAERYLFFRGIEMQPTQ